MKYFTSRAILIAGYYVAQRHAKNKSKNFGPSQLEDIGPIIDKMLAADKSAKLILTRYGIIDTNIKGATFNNQPMNTQPKQFATPLKIYGSMKQLKRMAGELEKMGYEKVMFALRPHSYLVTGYYNKSNTLTTAESIEFSFAKVHCHQCHCNDWQKVLALAAMVKGGPFQIGEAIVSEYTQSLRLVVLNESIGSFFYHRRATVEEIEKHFGTSNYINYDIFDAVEAAATQWEGKKRKPLNYFTSYPSPKEHNWVYDAFVTNLVNAREKEIESLKKNLAEEQMAHRATKQESSYAQLVTMKEKIVELEQSLQNASGSLMAQCLQAESSSHVETKKALIKAGEDVTKLTQVVNSLRNHIQKIRQAADRPSGSL